MPQPSSTGASAERRADVDHAVVLHRHERRSEAGDHPFDLRQEALVVGPDFDPDLVQRLCVQPCVPQLLEEAVAVRNARSFDVSVLSHNPGLPAASGTKTRILRADGRRDRA